MTRLRSFGRSIWEFVVGDDWRIAAGVVVALGVTAVIAVTSIAAWWILPVGVAAMLAVTVWRAGAPGR